MAKSNKKKDVATSIRDAKIDKRAQELLDKHIEFCVKEKLATKNDVMDMFYSKFENETPFANQLNKRGVEDSIAQKAAVESVKADLGRKVTQPKYGVILRPLTVRHETVDDPKRKGKKQPAVFIFGQCKTINLKNNRESDEKFCEISAYGPDSEKVEDVEESKIYYAEACSSNVGANLIKFSVDERCDAAKPSKKKLSDPEKLMTQVYDITSIKNVAESLSAGRYDYRLFEGYINYINYPKNKSWAKVELTDASIGLADLDKDKSKANLSMMVDAETMSKIGKGSMVRVLGQVKEQKSEQYGDSITLFFPPMVHVIFLNEPESIEGEEVEDEVEDASEYYNEKADDDFLEDKEKKDEASDDEKADDESEPEQTAAEAEEDAEEDDDPEEEEAEEEAVDEDPYDNDVVKESECYKEGEFGNPASINKDDGGYDEGCSECSKDNPALYKLCVQKSKE